MKSFFKIFFASLLALFVFTLIGFFLLVGYVSGLASGQQANTGKKAVLVLDLSTRFHEQEQVNPLAEIGSPDHYNVPGVYDVVRMINEARLDSSVKGILIRCNANNNGFGASEDIRNALEGFRASKKFVIAYGEVISQKAYEVASVADKIYCNPQGGVEWKGFAMQMLFLKGALDKLEIEPQVFYAGKFKSATEPFRTTQMTDANRLQSTVILNDLYHKFLEEVAAARHLDTATLKKDADDHLVQYATDALHYGLVDGLKYEDQVQDLLKEKLGLGPYDKINLVSMSKYAAASSDYKQSGRDKIALIYAEGDVVDGKGDRYDIGSTTYGEMIRKARTDNGVKAIVLRVNSGGGSALASENIWRELSLAKAKKPVVISFGDVAASGAYYLSCNADSIFAQPNTITGSIGVFSILPNMQKFFNNKLGITFDAVKTAPDADELSAVKPLTDMQKKYLQAQVDSIYNTFLSRVAAGREKDTAYVDSIGQGRIWSGARALRLGLVDRLGGLQDAIDCAARMAKTDNYRLREYPEPKSVFDLLLGGWQDDAKRSAVQEELGKNGMQTYTTLKNLKKMIGTAQTRMPFTYTFD